MKGIFSTLCLALVTSLVLATNVHAQTIPIDDFNDGDDNGWGHLDFSAGMPWGPAIYDASSGAYHLQTTGPVPLTDPGFIDTHWEASANNLLFANGFLRGNIRADTPGSRVGLLMRANDATLTSSGFYASSSFGTFYIDRFDPSQPNPQTIIAMADPALLPFAAGEDWNLEGGVVGDHLTLKAWRVGDPEPTSPLLSVTDSTFGPDGATEICALAYFDPAAATGPVQVSGTFDNITFTAVPEPGPCGLLVGLAVVAPALLRRRSLLSKTKRTP